MKNRIAWLVALSVFVPGATADVEFVSISHLASAASSLATTVGGGEIILNVNDSTGELPSFSGLAIASQAIGASSVLAASDFSLFLTSSQIITNGYANARLTAGADFLSGIAVAGSNIEIVFALDGPHHYTIHSVESQSQNADGAVALYEEHGRHSIFRYEHTHVHEVKGNLGAGAYSLQLTANTSSQMAPDGSLSVALFELELEIAEGSICPCDLNHDSFVDDADFVLFVSAYNELLCEHGRGSGRHGSCAADFTGDGMVDDSDFVIFAGAYNELICP